MSVVELDDVALAAQLKLKFVEGIDRWIWNFKGESSMPGTLSSEVGLRIASLQALQARMEKHEAAVLARMSAIDYQAAAITRELDAVEASVTTPATGTVTSGAVGAG